MTTLALAAALSLQAKDPTFQSYRAHIEAASAALASGSVKLARTWLEGAPANHRGWEWEHLAAQCDSSIATVRVSDQSLSKIQVSPDGKAVAVSCTDGTIRILDPRTLRLRTTLKGHTAPVFGLNFSADGTKLVSTGRDNTIRLWDTTRFEPIGVLGEHPVTPYNARFSPDGKKVVSVGWRMHPERKSPVGLIRVWDVESKSLLSDQDYTTHPISSLDFSPDGAHCYIGCWEYQVLDLNMSSYKVEREILPPPDRGYMAVDWVELDPAGTTMAAATKDKRVNLFDASTGRFKTALEHSGNVTTARFSADGRSIVTASQDNKVRVWDATGKLKALLRGHEAPVTCVALDPQGKFAYSSDSTGLVKKWAVDDTFTYAPAFQRGPSWSCTPDPTGKIIAIGTNERNIELRSLRDGTVMGTVGSFASLAVDVAWSPDGTRLAAGSNDGTFRAFDVVTKQELWQHKDTGQVRSAAWSKDGRFVAFGNGGSGNAHILAADTGKPVFTGKTAPGTVNAAFSPDSRTAYFAAAKTVWAVNLATMSPKTLTDSLASPAMELAVSPDGKRLTIGGEAGHVETIDAKTGRPVWTAKSDGTQWGIDYSPDGRRIASVGYDFALHLWDAATGQEVFALRNLPVQGFDTRFTPDGNTLVFMGGDGSFWWIDRRPFKHLIGPKQ